MTLSDEQRNQIKHLAKSLAELRDSLGSNPQRYLFAEFSAAGGDTAILDANEEGLVYFASIMMSLAAEASPGQHFHYDEHTVLSGGDMKLILGFLEGPYREWGNSSVPGGAE